MFPQFTNVQNKVNFEQLTKTGTHLTTLSAG